MRAVVLDKLDARLLLLPQLEMAIDGRRDDEIRAVLRSNGGEYVEPIHYSTRTATRRAERRRTV